ncbi:MAG: NADH-quinone oxidoreductase subunit C [Clostridiales bacterium]|nr:NADH-quinone oxidoreductase subunit C [Clostridiales bacterium]
MNNNIETFVEDIKSKYETLGVDIPKNNQVSLDFTARDIHSVLAYAKSHGWAQLSMLTCVDWIEENKLQLVYLLFNWENGVRLQVRTKLDRDKPVFSTITSIYPGAKYYERDVHEFFGVEFEGNPESYKPLFLENWDDMPPLLKDFDPQAYSDEKYPAREYEKDFTKKAGEK